MNELYEEIDRLRAEVERLEAQNKAMRERLSLIRDMPEYDQDDALRLRNHGRIGLEETGDWYCPKCNTYLHSSHVKFDETCETCGAVVYVPEPCVECKDANLLIDRLRAEADRLNETNKDLCVRLLEKEEANKELLTALIGIMEAIHRNDTTGDEWDVASAAIANARRMG